MHPATRASAAVSTRAVLVARTGLMVSTKAAQNGSLHAALAPPANGPVPRAGANDDRRTSAHAATRALVRPNHSRHMQAESRVVDIAIQQNFGKRAVGAHDQPSRAKPASVYE